MNAINCFLLKTRLSWVSPVTFRSKGHTPQQNNLSKIKFSVWLRFFFFFRSDMANSGGSCCIIMSKFEVIKKFVPTISVHYKLLFWSTCSSCLPFIDIGICTQVENIYIPKELLFKYYEDKYRRHNFILKQNEMPSLVENCMNSIHASCCKQQSWWFQEYHPQAGLHRWKFLKVFECKSCCSAPRLGCPLEKEEPTLEESIFINFQPSIGEKYSILFLPR